MSASITVKGFVATQPKFVIVGQNLAIANFRLGSSDRRFNTTTGRWETAGVSWYSVACFRDLASNAFASLNKGDPVIVSGRLKVSEWSAGDKSGLDVEIEADAVGHDLRWGKAMGFARTTARAAGGRDGEPHGTDDDQTPPDPDAESAASGWADPAAAIASATTEDAGEPTAFELVGIDIDEETGEVLTATGETRTPF
ncbi:MAG TPA: single-stranded DNA-binding protein [Gryllotalpicola sp.]